MNGKQVKRLRKIAKEHTHNYNNYEYKRVKGMRGMEEIRVLDKYSERYILKRMKRFHKNIPGPLRQYLVPMLLLDIHKYDIVPKEAT